MDFYGILFDIKNGSKVPYSKNYFDTLLAAKLEELGVKTLTGTLPLTFRTSETALRSWTVYGNNTPHNYSAEGTLPLTFSTHTAGAASDWEIEGNNDVGKNLVELTMSSGTYSNGGANLSYTIDETAGTLTLNGTSRTDGEYFVLAFSTSAAYGDYIISGGSEFASYRIWDATSNSYARKTDNSRVAESFGGDSTVRLPENNTFSHRIRIAPQTTFDNVVLHPMLRPAGTASDFEPYQIGVGQRTKNLFPSTAAETKTVGNLSVTSDGNGGYTINKTGALNEETIIMFDVPEFTVPVSQQQGGNGILALFNTKMTTGFQLLFYYNGERLTFASLSTAVNRIMTNYSNSLGGRIVDQIAVRMAATQNTDVETGVLSPMLTTDGISPSTFIPYGYEIPMTVTQQGQTTIIANAELEQGHTGTDTTKTYEQNKINSTIYIHVKVKNRNDTNWQSGYVAKIETSGTTFTVSQDWDIWGYLLIAQGNDVTYHDTNVRFCLTEGSTAPSTYIPYGYKVPISTQGKNLFDKSNLVTGSYYTAQGQTGNSNDWSRTVNAIPVLPNTEYTFESNSTAGASAKHLYLDADKNFISAIASGGSTFTTPSNCYYMQFSLRISSTNVMLVKGSTAPTEYIPYFHNDYTFYIGSSPLTAGQSISKTSTGVDIAAIAGSNTITTELYNKPEMSIEGVDYVGVGRPRGQDWEIGLVCVGELSPYKPNAPESNTSYVYNATDYTLDTDSRYKTALMDIGEGHQKTFTIGKTKGETFTIQPLNYMAEWGGVDHYNQIGQTITPTEETYTGETAAQYLLVTYYDSEADTLTPQEIRESITLTATVDALTSIPIDAPLTEGQSVSKESTGVDIETFQHANNTLMEYAIESSNIEMSITYKGG